jgi:hypothetical protein
MVSEKAAAKAHMAMDFMAISCLALKTGGGG